ncbi:hypothetical protein J4E81_005248 [Alternaria sp. BMP 2799]|nr:hypothetical protein J4E81_005248 [Alternaria sp. BMP 2799]
MSDDNSDVRPVVVKKTLLPSDPRNPLYYVERAGYPYPETSFYDNSDAHTDGRIHKPKYSDQDFTVGFNITIGKWYKLQNDIAIALFRRGLLSDDRSVKLPDLSLYDFMHRHGDWLRDDIMTMDLLSGASNAPVAWKESMVSSFIRRVAEWWKDNPDMTISDTGSILGGTDKIAWRLNPALQYEKFKGLYQMRHCEVTLAYYDGTSPDGDKCTFRCTELLSDASTTNLHEDIKAGSLRLELLRVKLYNLPSLPGETPEEKKRNADKLKISWQSKPGVWSPIDNDRRLQIAIREGRQPYAYDIEFLVQDNVNVRYTFEVVLPSLIENRSLYMVRRTRQIS